MLDGTPKFAAQGRLLAAEPLIGLGRRELQPDRDVVQCPQLLVASGGRRRAGLGQALARDPDARRGEVVGPAALSAPPGADAAAPTFICGNRALAGQVVEGVAGETGGVGRGHLAKDPAGSPCMVRRVAGPLSRLGDEGHLYRTSGLRSGPDVAFACGEPTGSASFLDPATRTILRESPAPVLW